MFCNILRELWKARNEELFQAKKSTPQGILASKLNIDEVLQPTKKKTIQTNPVPIPPRARVILVDASWDATHGTGIGW